MSLTQYVVVYCVNLAKWKVAHIWTNIKYYKNIKVIKFWKKCNTRSRRLFQKRFMPSLCMSSQVSIKTRWLALRWTTPKSTSSKIVYAFLVNEWLQFGWPHPAKELQCFILSYRLDRTINYDNISKLFSNKSHNILVSLNLGAQGASAPWKWRGFVHAWIHIFSGPEDTS